MSDRLERDIDRVLRAMVEDEGPADLRARVMRRLATETENEGGWRGRFGADWLAPAAAVAVLVLGLDLWLRPMTSQPPAPVTPRIVSGQRGTASPPAPSVAQVIARVLPRPVVNPEGGASGEGDIPPLAIVALAAPPKIDVPVLSLGAVDVAPIDIPALAFAPLSENSGS